MKPQKFIAYVSILLMATLYSCKELQKNKDEDEIQPTKEISNHNLAIFHKQAIEKSNYYFYLSDAEKYVCTPDDLSDIVRYRGVFQHKEQKIVHIYSGTFVDPTTFTYCSDPKLTNHDAPYVAYDKNFVFYYEPIPKVRELSFYSSALAIDEEKNVHLEGKILNELDFNTLLRVNVFGRSMMIDSSSIFVNDSKQNIDIDTIQFSGDYHFKDKDSLFFLDYSGLVKIMPVLDDQTPTPLSCYPNDRCVENFFKYGNSIIRGESIIAIIDQTNYFKTIEDSNHIYESNKFYHYLINDPVTENIAKLNKSEFSHIAFGYFSKKDTGEIYYYKNVVNGAKQDNFEVIQYKNKSYSVAKSDSKLYINKDCVDGIDTAAISEITNIHSGRTLSISYISSTGEKKDVYLVSGQIDGCLQKGSFSSD